MQKLQGMAGRALGGRAGETSSRSKFQGSAPPGWCHACFRHAYCCPTLRDPDAAPSTCATA